MQSEPTQQTARALCNGNGNIILFVCSFVCSSVTNRASSAERLIMLAGRATLYDNNNNNHRLRGSASTVLTATGQVNGRWRILTPHRIETHEPTATKFHTFDYVRERTP